MTFHKGDKVKWHDPAIGDYPEEEREDALNRVFEIFDINEDNGIISISDGYTEAQAYDSELEPIE